MKNIESSRHIISLLNQMSRIEAELRTLGVIRSRKLLGDLGEWYASLLFGFELAAGLSQKGYDCVCPKTGKRIQVKTDRKGRGQNAIVWMPEWTPDSDSQPFDELIIFWLAEDFRIKECFRLSIEQLTAKNFSKMKSGKLNITSSQLNKLGFTVSRNSFLQNDKTAMVFAE